MHNGQADTIADNIPGTAFQTRLSLAIVTHEHPPRFTFAFPLCYETKQILEDCPYLAVRIDWDSTYARFCGYSGSQKYVPISITLNQYHFGPNIYHRGYVI
jgi:hypothetical protein